MRLYPWTVRSFCSGNHSQGRSPFRSRLEHRPAFWGTFCAAPSLRAHVRSFVCSGHSYLSCRRSAYRTRLLRINLMGRFATPELRQMRAHALRQVSAGTLAARLSAVASVDVRNALQRVGVPSLYLRATEDRLVPGSAAKEFARLSSNARLVDIEGPHFLLQSRPAAAAQAISEFVRQVA